jgi:HlyD family secretion protein
MRTWIVVSVVAVAGIVALTAMWLFSDRTPAQVAKVRRASIREYVDEQGKTRLPETYLVTMPYTARIQQIELNVGDRARAGDVVAQVVPDDLADEVAEAQAAVDRLDASIAENDDISVESGLRTQAEKFVESMLTTVEAADEQQKASRKRLDYAESFLASTRKLVPTGAKTQDDVDRAEVEYVEGQVSYRQDVLLLESMRAIQAATALLPQMVGDYIGRKDLSRAVLEKQKSEAVAQLNQVLTREKRGTMKSEIDGTVIDRPIYNEQYLAAGTVLMEIGQIERLEVEADILSQDTVDIGDGAEVEIYGAAIGADVGGGVRGTVQRIYPAGFTKISSLGVEQQRVKVILDFAPGVLEELLASREFGVGYGVRVRIFTRTNDDALTVPRPAVFRGADGGWNVFAVRGGRATRVPVEVGLMNDQQVEITGGLAEGDSVILAPDSSIVDGTRIKAIER